MLLQPPARLMYRRRRLVIGGWAVILVGVVALANAAGGAFHTDYDVPGSDSQAAIDLLKRTGFDTRGGDQGQLVFTSTRGVDDPEVRAAVEPLFAAVEREVSRASVVSPYSHEGARQISENGRIAYAQVNLGVRAVDGYLDAGDEIGKLAEGIDIPGGRLELGGEIFKADAEQGTAEGVGLLAAIVILLIAFGSVLAMGLPIVTALFGVGTGVAVVLMLRNVLDLPNFTTAAVAMWVQIPPPPPTHTVRPRTNGFWASVVPACRPEPGAPEIPGEFCSACRFLPSPFDVYEKSVEPVEQRPGRLPNRRTRRCDS